MEWQLPVNDNLSGTRKSSMSYISPNAKIHCLDDDGYSLCGKLWMLPGIYKTTEFGADDIETYPEYFCKICKKKYKKMIEKG